MQEPKVLVGSLTCKVLRKQEFPGFGTVVTTRKNDVKFFSSLYSWATKSEVTSSASSLQWIPQMKDQQKGQAQCPTPALSCVELPGGCSGCVFGLAVSRAQLPAPPFPLHPCLRTPGYKRTLHAGFAFQVSVSGTIWQAGELMGIFSLKFASVHNTYCITVALKKPSELHYLFWLLL